MDIHAALSTLVSRQVCGTPHGVSVTTITHCCTIRFVCLSMLARTRQLASFSTYNCQHTNAVRVVLLFRHSRFGNIELATRSAREARAIVENYPEREECTPLHFDLHTQRYSDCDRKDVLLQLGLFIVILESDFK
jgi:hypothetical protein